MLDIERSEVYWTWHECALCGGDGLVVDNRTEELVDCPRCDGFGLIEPDEPRDEDEYEPDDDE